MTGENKHTDGDSHSDSDTHSEHRLFHPAGAIKAEIKDVRKNARSLRHHRESTKARRDSGPSKTTPPQSAPGNPTDKPAKKRLFSRLLGGKGKYRDKGATAEQEAELDRLKQAEAAKPQSQKDREFEEMEAARAEEAEKKQNERDMADSGAIEPAPFFW